MALCVMILRKMANNKWLQLNLWFGLTVCVALFSSMPLYADAILQRTLHKELQLMQAERNTYPGYMRVNAVVSDQDATQLARLFANMDRYVAEFPGRIGIGTLSGYTTRSTSTMRVYGADATEEELKNVNVVGSFRSVSNLEQQVRLIDGRMPDSNREDGVYEALVTQSFLIKLKRDLNDEITGVYRQTGQQYRILPVGVIEMAEPSVIDAYAPFPLHSFGSSFFIPYDVFESEFMAAGKAKLAGTQYVLALDYMQLKTSDIPAFVENADQMRIYLQNRFSYNGDLMLPALGTIETYLVKKERLEVTLLSLYAPVMLMLAFYLYMTAGMIIERQKTEISVLRSRGASRLQIMLSYTVEGIVTGAAAMAVGPPIGVLFTKVLGASDGFMSFVNRAPLDVVLTSDAYRIAAIAITGAIVLTLIPAFLATRTTIVGRKQQTARLERMPFWHKIGIDFILVALAIYMLIGFRRQVDDMQALALDAGSLQVDPLLFVMPALLALGGGLLILRVYPWVIRLFYWAGRRWWPPALYSTLVQISRSSGQYLTIKVFLIMTVATGLFSANSARTINDNMENKIRYAIGADVTLQVQWPNDAPPPDMMAPPLLTPGGALGGGEAASPNKRVQYTEPPWLPYQSLEGVESAARVFIEDKASISAARGAGTATLYGIETYEFGRTAWMNDGLLEHHLNTYLNLLASDPSGVLVSRSIADEFNIGPGDPIYVGWEGLDPALLTVFGIVDYWPGWNPLPQPGQLRASHLVVGHLGTIQNRLALEPYEVWLKLKEGAASADLYADIAANGINPTKLEDASQELIKSMNEPFRMAINGVMTLGFVIAMMISLFGFLVFWMLSLSGRTLQFGVLRAMGIPFGQVIGMLVSEQLLTSGAAVLIGVAMGNIVSQWYVPLFELSFNPSEQVPPFEIIYKLRDYLQLYGLVAFMLIIGLTALGFRLSRVKISQALKLGEE